MYFFDFKGKVGVIISWFVTKISRLNKKGSFLTEILTRKVVEKLHMDKISAEGYVLSC